MTRKLAKYFLIFFGHSRWFGFLWLCAYYSLKQNFNGLAKANKNDGNRRRWFGLVFYSHRFL